MARAPKPPTVPWDFQYCYGMPSKPTYLAGAECTFAAPLPNGSVHYLTKKYSKRASTGITLTVKVDQSPDAVWEKRPADNNTGTHPPSIRLFLQRSGDKMTLAEKYQFHRMWSCNHWIELRPGTQTISVPFIEANWSGVLGQKSSKGLTDTLAKLNRIGVTFGGGSFYGHGVRLATGSAQVTIVQYVIA